jgi:DNA-binding GntR family transcriptional regulator
MNGLIYIPFPRPEESPTSLMKRLAVHHGCMNMDQFRSLSAPQNYASNCLSTTTELAKWAASKAGTYSERFLSGFYQPEGLMGARMPHRVNNLTIPFNMIRWRHTIFCSECGAVEHEHFIKDLKLAAFCPYHNRQFLTNCPQCGVNLRWMNPLIDKCCYCDCRMFSPRCSEAATAPERYLLSLFRDNNQGKFDDLCDALQALQFFHHLQFLESRLILETAISVVTGDNKGVLRFLTTLKKQYPHVPNDAICAKLALLQKPIVVSACSAFRLGNESVMADSPLNTFDYSCSRENSLGSFNLTRTQARMSSSLEREYFYSILASFKIGNRCKSLTDGQVIEIFSAPHAAQYLKIDQESSSKDSEALHNPPPTSVMQPSKLSDFMQSTVDQPTAASLLGITTYSLEKLITAGLLKITPTNTRRRRIPVVDLDSFREKYELIESVAKKLGLTAANLKIQMTKLEIFPLKACGKTFIKMLHKEDSQKLLDALQNGPKHSSTNLGKAFKLQNILADHRDLYLTLTDASQAYDIKVSVLQAFIHHRVIQAVKIRNLDNAVAILRADLDNIATNYLSTNETCSLTGISQNRVRATLKEFGILPVLAPSNSSHPGWFYSRTAVQAFVDEQRSTSEASLTVQQTCEILRLGTLDVLALIKENAISADCDNRPSLLFASKKKVHDFFKRYASIKTISQTCGIRRSKLKNLLTKAGILPITSINNAALTSFYKISDLKSIGISKQKSSTQLEATDTIISNFKLNLPLKQHLSSAAVICSELGITFHCFKFNFVKTGFIQPIKICGKSYLKDKDINKLKSILSNYVDLLTARKIIGGSDKFDRLIRDGKITPSSTLPKTLSSRKFFLRSELDTLIASLQTTQQYSIAEII